METKRNVKYFTAPPLSIAALVGWGIVAIGAILLIIGSDLTVAGIITAIIGVAVIILSSGGKSTDTDLEFQISEKVKDLQEMNEKKFEVYEKSFLKMLKPVNLRGYDFEAGKEPFYFRKGADGMNRTNYFKAANLIFTNEKVFIYSRAFSLTDEAVDEVVTSSYYFNELSKAALDEKLYTYKKGDRDVEVKYYVFNLLKDDNTPALSLCVNYGADIDKYVEMITRAITTRQKELAKRAEETAQRRAEFRAKVEAEKAAIERGEMLADE